jgi:hypothetical protein
VLTTLLRRSRCRPRGKLVELGLMVVAASLVATPPALASPLRATATTAVSPPPSIARNCSTDVTASLNAFFARLPSGSNVVLPAGACYLTQGIVAINGTTGVTVEGNGARLVRTDPQRTTGWLPHLVLRKDTDLSIRGLGIQGTYVPGALRAGAGLEGHYGLVLSQDDKVTLDGLTVRGVSGDFLNLFPAPVTDPDQLLNRGIVVSGSTFDGAGYHGVTIEAADGATFENDSFSHVFLDTVDMEYDDYPTVFENGQPTRGGEDNITFYRDSWAYSGGYWFASLQGQEVQENNIRLIDNTLTHIGLSIWVRGNGQVPNKGLVVRGNRSDTALKGGSIASDWNIGQGTADLVNVQDADLSGNTIPFFDGLPKYYPNHPYKTAVMVWGNSSISVESNDFVGAKLVFENMSTGRTDPGTAGSTTICGNRYGVGGMLKDQACP